MKKLRLMGILLLVAACLAGCAAQHAPRAGEGAPTPVASRSPSATPASRFERFGADNPIDEAFSARLATFDKDEAVVRARTARAYLDAWQQELAFVGSKTKEIYQFTDDHPMVDDFMAGYERAAQAAYDIELANHTNLYQRPERRAVDDTGVSDATMAQAQVYREGTLTLIANYRNFCKVMGVCNLYLFKYDGTGVYLK
nr:hypothetical protein [Maliibacterium massiliense]